MHTYINTITCQDEDWEFWAACHRIGCPRKWWRQRVNQALELSTSMLKDLKWEVLIVEPSFEQILFHPWSPLVMVETKPIFPFNPLRRKYSRLSDDLGILIVPFLCINCFVRQTMFLLYVTNGTFLVVSCRLLIRFEKVEGSGWGCLYETIVNNQYLMTINTLAFEWSNYWTELSGLPLICSRLWLKILIVAIVEIRRSSTAAVLSTGRRLALKA